MVNGPDALELIVMPEDHSSGSSSRHGGAADRR
jgi:hypothetical protein